MNAPEVVPTHRNQPRVVSSGLEAAIVHRRFVWLTDYEYCYLININAGGLGIASETLDVKVGKKLELEIYHSTETFVIRSIVMHKAMRGNKYHYGLAFVDTPPELDRLIAMFLNAHVDKEAARPSKDEASSQRNTGERLRLPDAEVFVKKRDSKEAYLLCRVENISRGGLGFYCSHKFAEATPFEVSVEIDTNRADSVISGVVVHMQKKLDKYYYGMEYVQVPEEFLRLLDTVAGGQTSGAEAVSNAAA